MTKEQKAVIIGLWRMGAAMFEIAWIMGTYLPQEIKFVINNHNK